MRRQLGLAFMFFVFFTSQFFRALPANNQWTKISDGLPLNFYGSAIDAVDNKTAVVLDQTLYRTLNGGESWLHVALPNNFKLGTDISIIEQSHIWISGAFGHIYATTNGGQNWTLQYSDTTMTKFIIYVVKNYVHLLMI